MYHFKHVSCGLAFKGPSVNEKNAVMNWKLLLPLCCAFVFLGNPLWCPRRITATTNQVVEYQINNKKAGFPLSRPIVRPSPDIKLLSAFRHHMQHRFWPYILLPWICLTFKAFPCFYRRNFIFPRHFGSVLFMIIFSVKSRPSRIKKGSRRVLAT